MRGRDSHNHSEGSRAGVANPTRSVMECPRYGNFASNNPDLGGSSPAFDGLRDQSRPITASPRDPIPPCAVSTPAIRPHLFHDV